MIDKQKLRRLLGGGQDVEINEEDLLSEYKSLVDNKSSEILRTCTVNIDFNYNPNVGVIETLGENVETLLNAIKELQDMGYTNVDISSVNVIGACIRFDKVISYGEFKQNKIRIMRHGFNNPTPLLNAQNYIKECLGINMQHGGVRSIYIKLFLDGKINEEDLASLIVSKNIDIDLIPYYSYDTPEELKVDKKEEDKFCFIS